MQTVATHVLDQTHAKLCKMALDVPAFLVVAVLTLESVFPLPLTVSSS